MDEYNDQEYQPESEASSPEKPQEQTWDGVSEPKAANFTDYDEYVKKLSEWQVARTMRQLDEERISRSPQSLVEVAVEKGLTHALQSDRAAMAQAQAQAQRDLGPYPDDELFGPRTEALEWIEMCKKKEAKARRDGDEERAHAWLQRAQFGVKDIEKMGKSQAEKYAEEVSNDVDFRSIDMLFNKENSNDKKWESPRMIHDAGIVVARHNARNQNGVIALPMESSPWGDVLPVHPKNMCQVQLPKQQYETFKRLVYASDDNTPEGVFRRSWQALRSMGYGDAVTPAFEKKAKNEVETEDPEKMTFKECCAWREQTGKKRNAQMFPDRRGGAKR